MKHKIEKKNESTGKPVQSALAFILGQGIYLGATLQIGFGNAFSLDDILSLTFSSYTILEKDAEKISKAKDKMVPEVIFSAQSWQEALEHGALYDTIIFNGLDTEELLFTDQAKQAGHLFLSRAEQIISNIHRDMPHLTTIQYGFDELSSFFDKQQTEDKTVISRFAMELKQNKQISDDVYTALKERYGLIEDKVTAKENIKIDPITSCLLQVLEKHLHPRGKFIALSPCAISKFEDPFFFEKIITDVRYNFHETCFPWQKDASSSKEALVFIVEKTG